MTEEWRPVVGFEGLYEVSDLGRVRRLDRVIPTNRKHGVVLKLWPGRIMAGWPHKAGYRMITLSRGGETFAITIHSLVMAAFVGPRPEGHEIAHNNGRRSDNRVINLRYDTKVGNFADKLKHGTQEFGENHKWTVLTLDQVRDIRRRPADRSQALADEFGVTRTCINHIRAGRTWRHAA